MMNTYDFTLKFGLPSSEGDMDDLVERLAETGCDDALVGIGKTGRLALEFSREAHTASDAITAATKDVERATPGAKLIEATPDLVGLTDVADIVGCSRQYIRKIMVSGGSEIPVPVHEGKSPLWRLSKVLAWLAESKDYDIDDTLMDVATANMRLNVLKEAREAGVLDARL